MVLPLQAPLGAVPDTTAIASGEAQIHRSLLRTDPTSCQRFHGYDGPVRTAFLVGRLPDDPDDFSKQYGTATEV